MAESYDFVFRVCVCVQLQPVPAWETFEQRSVFLVKSPYTDIWEDLAAGHKDGDVPPATWQYLSTGFLVPLLVHYVDVAV